MGLGVSDTCVASFEISSTTEHYGKGYAEVSSHSIAENVTNE